MLSGLSLTATTFGWIFVISSLVTSHKTVLFPVNSYAALGDSYASGDGAGSSKLLPVFDAPCGRFSDAYPIQVSNSTKLGLDEKDFLNLACGGATTTSVLAVQAPWIGNSDLVTLTVGGNQVDFFVVLNECIQQWRPFSTCEEEIEKSRKMVESSSFIRSYDEMIQGTIRRLKPGARLLVTGYSTFFNEETNQCDHISFSTTNPSNYLTKELRRKVNDLVRLLNDVIKAATTANGAEYVDLERVFEGHRFCEEGVTEPDTSRDSTWFFTIEYDQDPSVGGLLQQQSVEQAFPKPIEGLFKFSRVFHPTGLGHRGISKAIVGQILQY